MARRRIRVADVKEILVHWDAGGSVSGIAATLGYSRPTVRKDVQAAVQTGLVRGSRPRDELTWERLARAAIAQVGTIRPPGAATAALVPSQPYLEERVGQVRLSVLYQRLHAEQHLAVSWATFSRYVRAQWPQRLRPPVRVTVPLADPPPGEEAQVDFFFVGLWEDPESGRRCKLSAFLLTLAHSRHQFLYPVLGEDMAAWLAAHVAAFTFLGGAPRRLVPDKLTAAILKADRYDPRLNRTYGELVRYYGCVVDPARVARPTDKPRVERNVDYARHSFFDGRTFASLAAMWADAARWCREVAGQRIHGTTGEQPYAAVLARERAALRPRPPRPWELVSWFNAKVPADCRLRVGGGALLGAAWIRRAAAGRAAGPHHGRNLQRPGVGDGARAPGSPRGDATGALPDAGAGVPPRDPGGLSGAGPHVRPRDGGAGGGAAGAVRAAPPAGSAGAAAAGRAVWRRAAGAGLPPRAGGG